MLPGFLPQSTPPALPSAVGGDLPAAPGAGAIDAAAVGEAFTSALDSACDAHATCGDPAQGSSTDKPAAGTSPGLAAWLLALGCGDNPSADGATNAHATQQASSEGDAVTLPVTGDDEDADEASVAEAANAGDPSGAVVVAPIVESVPAAETPLPQLTDTASDAPVGETSGDSAMAVTGNSAETATSGRATGWHSAPDAGSDNDVSASERDAPSDREAINGRTAQARPSNDPGARPEAVAAAAEPVDGADVSMPSETSTAVARTPSQSSPADRLQTADARSAAGHRPASAGSGSAHASSASQGVAAAAATITDPAAAANADVTVVAQAGAAAATVTGDARALQRAAGAAADEASQADHAVSSATAQGSALQGGSQGGVFQGGESSRDSSRQNQDAEASGRPRGLDVAVTRSAAAAMLTLIAGPDGALRLTPAAMAAPVLAPILPQDQTANIDQLVQTMRVMVKDQVTEATVHLRPQHFGEVSIQVRMDGKSVSAIIHTESSQVRDWMLGQEGTLRTGLSEQGLQLDRLVVQRDGRQDRRDTQQQQPERRRQRQREQSESQPTFEVTV